jgi:hypothetical protein
MDILFLSANNVFNTDFVETVGYQTLGRNVRFEVHFKLLVLARNQVHVLTKFWQFYRLPYR